MHVSVTVCTPVIEPVDVPCSCFEEDAHLQGHLDDGLAQQRGAEEGPEWDAQVAARDACTRQRERGAEEKAERKLMDTAGRQGK